MKNTTPSFRRAAIRYALALPLITIFQAPATAREYRVCIGEYERQCPEHDVFEYCSGNPEAIAARVCSKTVNGVNQPGRFRLIMLGDRGGNKCGYSWYSLLCVDE
jgi:hypothetical protein